MALIGLYLIMKLITRMSVEFEPTYSVIVFRSYGFC